MTNPKNPDGHPMDAIAEQFEPSGAPPHQPEPVSLETADQPGTPDSSPSPQSSGNEPISREPFSLSLHQIASPAFFVDHQLTFRWMAPGSSDPFSQALKATLESDDSRHIFKLLANSILQESILDWQRFFAFAYTVLRRRGGDDTAATDAEGLAAKDRHDPEIPLFTPRETFPFTVDSCQLRGGPDGISWRIYALDVDQGTLFLLRQDQSQPEPADGQDARSVDASLVDRTKTVGVLVAQLNDAHRISDSMLPDGFFHWLNRVCEEADGLATTCGGRRAECRGTQLHYVFAGGEEVETIFNAIQFANRLNQHMQALETQLLSQGQWAGDIRFNIGISHRVDQPAETTAGTDMERMLPGGAFDLASRLAVMASTAEIWITKDAAASLSPDHFRRVVMGVDHQGQFLRDRFTRVADLPRAQGAGQPNSDLGTLSIARIIDIRPSGPGQSATHEE